MAASAAVDSVAIVIDWNPNDPDEPKVYYDLSGWTIDQRAELLQALAADEIAHVWEDEELVVPDVLETDVDAIFERLEEALGPFPIALDDSGPAVEYDLGDWPASERHTLAAALVQGGIAHRWENAALFVGAESEVIVDQLLDAVESGTLLVDDDGDGGNDPAADTLPRLFAAADRLAKDSEDSAARDEVVDLAATLDIAHAPYGVGGAVWSKVMVTLGALRDLVADPGSSSSDIIGSAQQLRALVRQYVA